MRAQQDSAATGNVLFFLILFLKILFVPQIYSKINNSDISFQANNPQSQK